MLLARLAELHTSKSALSDQAKPVSSPDLLPVCFWASDRAHPTIHKAPYNVFTDLKINGPRNAPGKFVFLFLCSYLLECIISVIVKYTKNNTYLFIFFCGKNTTPTPPLFTNTIPFYEQLCPKNTFAFYQLLFGKKVEFVSIPLTSSESKLWSVLRRTCHVCHRHDYMHFHFPPYCRKQGQGYGKPNAHPFVFCLKA